MIAALPPSMPTGKPTNAEFPTSASTPPVNIMTPEPPLGAAPKPSRCGCAGIAGRAASGRGDTAGTPPAQAAAKKPPPAPKRPSPQRRSSSRRRAAAPTADNNE